MNTTMRPIDYAKLTIDTMMRKYDAADLPPKGAFHYHQGVFLSGVYENYLHSYNEEWFLYMKDWVDSMLDENGKIIKCDHGRLDDVQPGNLLFPIFERTGEDKYKNAINELIDVMKHFPKNKEGGFWHMIYFKDEMWLDGLYMGGPFVCKYARMFNSPDCYDISADQVIIMREKTRDENTGLWYHAYDCERVAEWANKETGRSPEFWGRSVGWVPVAILDELDYIPKTHPKYDILCKIVRDLLIAVCNFQSEDGRWYQVIDKGTCDGNWLENSCSCLFTAAICKAVRHNILEEDYLEKAKKAYRGVIDSLTWDAEGIQIGNVCIGTGVGNYKHYCDRPTSTNDLHGVGAFLLMCSQMEYVV